MMYKIGTIKYRDNFVNYARNKPIPEKHSPYNGSNNQNRNCTNCYNRRPEDSINRQSLLNHTSFPN